MPYVDAKTQLRLGPAAQGLKQVKIDPDWYLEAVDRVIAVAADCQKRNLDDLVESMIIAGVQQGNLWDHVVEVTSGLIGRISVSETDADMANRSYQVLVKEARTMMADALKTCWR